MKEKQITKIIFSVPSEGERLALQKYVQENFEEMNITFSSDRYIEFNSKEADKGQAALHLGELLESSRKKSSQSVTTATMFR